MDCGLPWPQVVTKLLVFLFLFFFINKFINLIKKKYFYIIPDKGFVYRLYIKKSYNSNKSNPIFKIGKEDIPLADKHMKRCRVNISH